MIYKLFYNAEQINKRLSINPFGDLLPRVGDTLQLRITEHAVGTTHGNTKLVVILKVYEVRFHIENDRDDTLAPTEIHISVTEIYA